MNHAIPENGSGYALLIDMLKQANISLCSGVTGGGVIHFLKYLAPHAGQPHTHGEGNHGPRFFSLGEYSAGFVPLGSYLATGEIGACVATTGAATKLLACGLSDAKLHDIPAVYLVPISAPACEGLCPLQDTSAHGSNIVAQLRAELPSGVFVLDDPATLGERLAQAREQLVQHKPVALVLVHDALSQPAAAHRPAPRQHEHPLPPVGEFVKAFARHIEGRRVTLLAGEELARCTGAPELTSKLCEQLGAAAVWSINGSNGIARDNAYGYGYIGFGGNDAATQHWQSLGEQDVLLVLGACPDEYTVNLAPYAAGNLFVLTALTDGYGQIDGSFQHRAGETYHQLVAPLEEVLAALVEHFVHQPPRNQRMAPAPASLNQGHRDKPRPGHVDIVQLFEALDQRWPAGTLGFDDVCLSYKDRQYVTQRPNPKARFFSLYRGSAMGNALGLAIGAKVAAPASLVVAFTGDGCFRLFAGNLSEASNLGILLFVLDNGCYGIVEQGLPVIIPDLEEPRYHTHLPSMDFCAMARACGWKSFDLAPDLDNLDHLFAQSRQEPGRSILVRIPVDAQQVVGLNPRARNL